MRSIFLTGAAGNLGGKLLRSFVAAPWCDAVVAADRIGASIPHDSPKVKPLPNDLTRASHDEHMAGLKGTDTVVHFAVVDPAPDASWPDSAVSLEMSSRLVIAAREAGLRRFIFASSNHAVGRLKDGPALAPGSLTADRIAPGTRWETPDGVEEGCAYGASKAFTERLCLAAAIPGQFTTVSIRIGWCQRGENLPHTLTAGGRFDPSGREAERPNYARDLAWFRNMWLSDRDFTSLFERAVLADAAAWPAPGIVVNGMSANAGMPWDIETTRRLLGYEPRDNVWAHV